MRFKQLRSLLLLCTFVSVLSVLGRAILSSPPSERKLTYVFPPVVPLPGWQPVGSSPLAAEGTVVAAKRYQYRGSGHLDIEMRYLSHRSTSFGVKRFIQNYTSIPLPPGELPIHQQSGVGFYSLFVHQKRAYLSACINPRGGSTVTYNQFNHNRMTYDVRLNRLPQLLGQGSLRDRRCLWTHFSMPIQQSPASTYPVLEKAWFDWYRWWSPRFPAIDS